MNIKLLLLLQYNLDFSPVKEDKWLQDWGHITTNYVIKI